MNISQEEIADFLRYWEAKGFTVSVHQSPTLCYIKATKILNPVAELEYARRAAASMIPSEPVEEPF